MGESVLDERERFRDILTTAPDRPGVGRFVEINDSTSLQGFVPETPSAQTEEGFFANLDGVQVNYRTEFTEPNVPVSVRTVMYHTSDHSDPNLWKLDTWYRETTVLQSDGTVLGDEARHSTAVYPGQSQARNGLIVSHEDLQELPLSEKQKNSLAAWNIAL